MSSGSREGAPFPTIDSLQVAALEERYKIGELLGEGRFSSVFAGWRSDGSDGTIGDEFALKALELQVLHSDEEALEMLEAEVAALQRAAEHEHLRKFVVKLHEVICTPDTMHLAMDRVDGRELFQAIDSDGAFPEPLARRLMAELMGALAGMHAVGIVHRDIKPENLIVSHLDDVENARLVVIDFGYAALLVEGGIEGLAGSPEYAAPEVLSWIEAEMHPETVGSALPC